MEEEENEKFKIEFRYFKILLAFVKMKYKITNFYILHSFEYTIQ